jgi:hypothetical protein
MQRRGPAWLIEALANRPWGFQADVARHAGLSPDKLTKILSGERALKHHEGELLKEAVAIADAKPKSETGDQLQAPEGSLEVGSIVGRKPWAGRPAELVFLLENRNYVTLQLDGRLLDELRRALREMTGS